MLASKHGHANVSALLLTAGADIECTDSKVCQLVILIFTSGQWVLCLIVS